MSLSTWNSSLTAYENVKGNILADKMAKNRWGNKFKRLFNKHKDSVYGYYPAYSFLEGMKDCTNAEGSTADKLTEAQIFRENLNLISLNGVFTLLTKHVLDLDEYAHSINDVSILEVNYIVDESEKSFDKQDGKVLLYLRDLIIEQGLFDYSIGVDSEQEITVPLSILKLYSDNVVAELTDYSKNESRANDDLNLINHLGLCSTLASEISNPHSVTNIYFRFRKSVESKRLYTDSGFALGLDVDYAWWEEEQFSEIRKHVENFQDYCIFIPGDYVKGNVFTTSYIYVDNSIFELAGYKIYWFVKALFNLGIYVKRDFFSQIFGIAIFVIGLYLTAISANPAWMKIALVSISVANFSGALSQKAQLLTAVITIAYGLSNSSFSTMSSSQMFSWAINNVEMVFKMVQTYEMVKAEEKQTDDAPHKVQDQAMEFIYRDAYSQYDNFYSVMYDYEPKYKTI